MTPLQDKPTALWMRIIGPHTIGLYPGGVLTLVSRSELYRTIRAERVLKVKAEDERVCVTLVDEYWHILCATKDEASCVWSAITCALSLAASWEVWCR